MLRVTGRGYSEEDAALAAKILSDITEQNQGKLTRGVMLALIDHIRFILKG